MEQPKVVLKHSHIEVSNYELGDAPRLEYLFSVWDPVNYRSYPKGIEYDHDKKILYLPRGMDVDILSKAFIVNPYVDYKCDPFTMMDPIPIKYLARDQRQVEIIKFILGMDNYQYTKQRPQIAINSTTGSGKTFATVASICITGSRAIIITSSIGWLEQWKEKIMEYTPLKENDIHMIIGAPSIDKLLVRGAESYKIFLASHDTIKGYGNRYGWDAVEELFKFMKVSFKVFDEAHKYFDNMARIDFHTNTKKTLYLTATPALSNDAENLIFQMYFRNVPAIELFDENNDPHVNYFGMLFKSHPTPLDVSNFNKGRYKFDRNAYMDYLVTCDNLYKLVDIIFDLTWSQPGKVLIYVGKNDALAKVYDYFVNTYPFVANCIGIFTSVVTDEEKEIAKRMKFILSTTKSTGTASDIADLCAVVVLDEPFKSPVLARQTLGRCRASGTSYLDCVDIDSHYAKKYYQQKQPIFQTYAKSCKEHFFSDEELDERSTAIQEKYSSKKMLTLPYFPK